MGSDRIELQLGFELCSAILPCDFFSVCANKFLNE